MSESSRIAELEHQLRGAHAAYKDLEEQLETLRVENEEMAMVLDGQGWKRVRTGQWERQEADGARRQQYEGEQYGTATARVAELEQLIARCYAGESFDLLWGALERPLKEYLAEASNPAKERQ